MIDYLDNMLRHLFISQIDIIKNSDQIGFQPPDKDWRTYVSNQDKNALNVYLLDIRENLELRSNSKVRSINNGIISETPVPRRIDCHYLITVWSPGKDLHFVEPSIDEHTILYQVVAVLMKNEPLVPKKIYNPDPLPENFPQEIAEKELPMSVLPTEGFLKLSEFWGTMDCHWKPVVYLVITLPVILQTQIAGPVVTTRITEYRQTGNPDTAERWIQIGGQVLNGNESPPEPISNAWIQIETNVGISLQNTQSNELGRFTFSELKEGSYVLRVRAQGFPEKKQDIMIPSTTGNYDVTLG